MSQSTNKTKAIIIAKGKYLYILNPDTELLDNNLSQLFKFIENKENIAVVGPAIYTKSKKLQQSYWKKPNLFNTLLSIMYLDLFINRKMPRVHFFRNCC